MESESIPCDPTVSIVVPAKNEAKNLQIVLPLLPDVHEIIVVDGHSVDNTVEVASTVRPGVKVITQTRRGKGNALVVPGHQVGSSRLMGGRPPSALWRRSVL